MMDNQIDTFVFIRRTDDWHGSSGFEAWFDSDSASAGPYFAYTVKQLTKDILTKHDAAGIWQWKIESAVTTPEKEYVNYLLQSWRN